MSKYVLRRWAERRIEKGQGWMVRVVFVVCVPVSILLYLLINLIDAFCITYGEVQDWDIPGGWQALNENIERRSVQ